MSTPLESPAKSESATSPDDLLPPVEPPSAGFLVQLFVVPALIVAGIALVWLLVNSVVLGRTTDPRVLIKGLERSGVTRWQTALEIANVLRDPRHDAVKKDPDLAKQLGQVLERSIRDGNLGQEAVTMRYFVAGAIGLFHVDDGLPALLLSAQTRRDAEELDAQLAAIRAIALLASTMQEQDAAWATEQTDLAEVFDALARDEEDRVRSDVAFALGVVETSQATDQLRRLVDDSYPDARFNAAVALARRGDEAAVETLVEMLDLDESAGLDLEKAEAAKPQKRTDLITNASRATILLAQENKEVDLGPIIEQLQRVAGADAAVRDQALLQPVAINEAKVALEAIK